MTTLTRTFCIAGALAFAAALTGCKEDETSAVATAPARVCHDCGTISAIEPMSRKGEASGAGAVMGAVAGAVIGHQFGGNDRSRDMATAGGAVAGGVAGHEIEKRKNTEHWYHVTVAMNDGGTRTVDVTSLNGMAVGSKVKVVGNSLQVASR